MIPSPHKEKTAGASAGPAFRPGRKKDRLRTRQGKLGVPTFALLREKRRLRVVNPDNGARFSISLRDWQELLWAVRVEPEPAWRQSGNAFTTSHRIMPRWGIEDWLAGLHLA